MGGLIFVFLVLLVVAILLTPAMRARFGGKPPPQDKAETPHEVVIRRLDDHRKRRNGKPEDTASGE